MAGKYIAIASDVAIKQTNGDGVACPKK